jgi:hypothetical protein
VPGILEDLRPLKPQEIDRLDLSALPFTGRIVNNAKVSDHHAIIPTGKRPGGGLAPATQKVYDAVVTRLIAAFYPACIKEVTTVNGESNAVPFRARGVRVLDPGWTVLYPRKDDDKKNDEQDLPEFRVGETGPHEPFVRRGETTPPKSYTENTLLGAMETAGKLVEEEQLKEALKERGLGTPATRAAIIETLIERGYIARDKKSLAATDLGRYLIAIVRDRSLKSPELTGDWEARLRQVERGALDRRAFMAEIVRYTADVTKSARSNEIDPTRLGDCPRCGRPVIEGKRGYGCSGWRDGCPFVLWREYKGRTLVEAQVRELLQHRVLLEPLAIEGGGAAILQLMDSGEVAEVPVPTGGPKRGTAAASRNGRTSRRTSGRSARSGSAKRDGAAPARPRASAKPARQEPRPPEDRPARRLPREGEPPGEPRHHRPPREGEPPGEPRFPHREAQAPGEPLSLPARQEPRPPGRRDPEAAPGRERPSREEDGTPRKPAAGAKEGFGPVPLGACPLCGSDVVEQEKSFGCSGWKQGCKFAIWKTIAGKSIGARTAQGLLRRGRTPVLRGFRSKAGNRFDARLKLDGGEVRFEFDAGDRRRPPRSPDTA